MTRARNNRLFQLAMTVAAVTALLLGGASAPAEQPPAESTARVIVQGESAQAAAHLVNGVGGTVTHELTIINAVAATVTPEQRRLLADVPALRIYADREARVAGTPQPDTFYPTRIGASDLHRQGVTGLGVTVAVLDTGAWYTYYLHRSPANRNRMLANYDAIGDRMVQGSSDGSGHGTHVSSVILSSGKTRKGKLYNGVAPNADLVVVRAFDASGAGSYADVIRGLGWVVANRDSYGIRVLNLSFSAPARSHYWDDPLNQAVMAAWQAGIVVVASAGNGGPDPMTVGVPGNVPYILTVGAMSDAATLKNQADDFLTSFSAAGPTVEGFVKPELVAPGGHMRGIMQSDHRLASTYPQFYETSNTFVMSGTSQAAAVVSGVAALVLEADPSLSPDDVKCRLMASARPAVDRRGRLAYSVFQQGAGMVHAGDAVEEQTLGCANAGLDVALDLAGVAHFGGRADREASGVFFLRDVAGDGFQWSDGYTYSRGYAWSDGYAWNDGYAWSDAYMWSDGATWNRLLGLLANGFAWSDAYMWSDAFAWSDGFAWNDMAAVPMSINSWVEQE